MNKVSVMFVTLLISRPLLCAVVTHFAFDGRVGERTSLGSEELSFSNLWTGDSGATVTISQDGVPIFNNLTGEGSKTWSVDRNGRYVLAHTTYVKGCAISIETAVFRVKGKGASVEELMVDWGQKNFFYDGKAKEPTISIHDGEDELRRDIDYTVSYSRNVNVGTALVIVHGVNPYFGSVTNTFEILKGRFPSGARPDSIDLDPSDLLKPFSEFDNTCCYDGTEFTVKTKELEEAFSSAIGADMVVSYSQGEVGVVPVTGWSVDPPAYSAVGTNVVWYKVSSVNYEDYVHVARVSICPRSVTLTSGAASKCFDGNALTEKSFTVSGDGFMDVDGVVLNFLGSQLSPGTSANTFTYSFKPGTQSENYFITQHPGTLTVTPGQVAANGSEPGAGSVLPGGISKFDATPVKYDGKEHTINVAALETITLAGSTPTFCYALTKNGPFRSEPYTFTNAGMHTIWYKVSATNYDDFVHEAQVKILPREVMLTSDTASKNLRWYPAYL